MPGNDFDKNRSPFGKQNQGMYFGIFLVIVLLIFAGIMLFSNPAEQVPYSKFLTYVQNKQVIKVTISGQNITGEYIT
jgi:Ni,Fe-hydrogenase I cytochrome b subunit